MKVIPLTKGQIALVDDADYEIVSQFKWHAHKVGRRVYAARNVYKPDGKRAVQLLHRFLMPGVAQIDHRDGNGCNDQRENLRPATHQQNGRGLCRKKTGTYSRFRGVTWDKRVGMWKAQIKVEGKQKYLGYFDSETDAARAYDAAARKYFRDGFQQLNFP